MYINTIEELDWWNTLDMRCAILNHRWSMMFGSGTKNITVVYYKR
jgi:hypothetical protein